MLKGNRPVTHDVQVFVHEGPVPRSWAAGTISDVVHKALGFSDSTRTRSIGTKSNYLEAIDPGDVLSCGCRLQHGYPVIIANPLKNASFHLHVLVGATLKVSETREQR